MKVMIVVESVVSKKKPYYERKVMYEQIAQWVSESKAVLNISLKNQEGLIVRELKSVFNKVKLVTTNKCVKNLIIFNPNNVFILKDDTWKELIKFLKSPYDMEKQIDLNCFSTENEIQEITETDE